MEAELDQGGSRYEALSYNTVSRKLTTLLSRYWVSRLVVTNWKRLSSTRLISQLRLLHQSDVASERWQQQLICTGLRRTGLPTLYASKLVMEMARYAKHGKR